MNTVIFSVLPSHVSQSITVLLQLIDKVCLSNYKCAFIINRQDLFWKIIHAFFSVIITLQCFLLAVLFWFGFYGHLLVCCLMTGPPACLGIVWYPQKRQNAHLVFVFIWLFSVLSFLLKLVYLLEYKASDWEEHRASHQVNIYMSCSFYMCCQWSQWVCLLSWSHWPGFSHWPTSSWVYLNSLCCKYDPGSFIRVICYFYLCD